MNATTKSRAKSTRARPAQRAVRTVRHVKRAVPAATSFLETETGKLIAWGAAGFIGVLALAGIAAALVETGTVELPSRRELESRLKAIQNSKTPQEALSWLNRHLSDLRDEVQTQIARIS